MSKNKLLDFVADMDMSDLKSGVFSVLTCRKINW